MLTCELYVFSLIIHFFSIDNLCLHNVEDELIYLNNAHLFFKYLLGIKSVLWLLFYGLYNGRMWI